MNSKIQDRFALPVCAALALLGTGVAALLPSQRIEGLVFLIGTALLTFLVLRFVGAVLAVSLAIGSATVVSLFDLWLRGEATPATGVTLALGVAASAFPWGRWCLLVGTATALLVAAIELDAFGGPASLLDAEPWRNAWQKGSLWLPIALIVGAAASVVLAERLRRLAATRPAPQPLPPRRPALQVLEAVPHAVAVYDGFGQLLSANSVWRTMHAATREDPSGEHSGTVELHERGSGTFRRCLLGETITDERTLLLRPDGTKEWISTSMSPWYEDGPDVVVGGVLITKTSVSEVAELELERDALRGEATPTVETGLGTLETLPQQAVAGNTGEDEPNESSAHVSALSEAPEPDGGESESPGLASDSSVVGEKSTESEEGELVTAALRVFPDVLFLLDATGRITEVHAAEESQGGLASVQLVGTEIGLAFPALYEATKPENLASLGQRVHRQEFEIAAATGTPPMRFESRLTALPGDRYIVLNRQLSDGTETARESGQEILAMAAHDLGEPLRALRSYLDLLEKEYDEKLDETGREFLAFARQGAHRLGAMIARLNELSSATAGPIKTLPTDLKQALAEALEALELQIEETNAHVFSERLPDVLANHSDAVLLFQNLISNSLKYRSEAAPEIVIEGRVDGDDVVIRLTDNGLGIPVEERQRVFEPFARLHAADEIEGTGLGLAICRRLTERHGGSIRVDGEPGRGTEILMTFPRTKTSPTND